MLDIKFIRENKDAVKKNCELRNIKCDVDRLLELDEKRIYLIGKVGNLKEKKNAINDKMKSGEDRENLIVEGKKIKEDLEKTEPEFEEVEKEWKKLIITVPNMTHPDSPIGKDDSENI